MGYRVLLLPYYHIMGNMKNMEQGLNLMQF